MATDQKPVSLASQYRKRRREGRPWTAPSGATIRIRSLSLSDHTVVGQLPTNLQQIVYKAIDASTKLNAAATEDDVDIDDVFGELNGEEKLIAMNDTSVRLAKIGWIEPRLVDTVTDEDLEIGVEEVDSDDLLAYMGMIFGGQQAEAEQLTPFPEQSSVGLGDRSDEPAIQPAAEPARETDTSVLRHDRV